MALSALLVQPATPAQRQQIVKHGLDLQRIDAQRTGQGLGAEPSLLVAACGIQCLQH